MVNYGGTLESAMDTLRGESTVSIININNGIKELIHGYQDCITKLIFTFGGYLEVKLGWPFSQVACQHS